MLLCICLNPALDITYELDQLVVGASHRVAAVMRRPGGKALNTANVLAQLGETVVACGFVGGAHGEQLREYLADTRVIDDLTEIQAETRQTVTLTARSDATVINEAGPAVSDTEWQALLRHVEGHLDSAEAVMMSGSVPPGLPADAYAQLVRRCRIANVPSLVDASGRQLLEALAAAPSIVAPNREEALEALTDRAAGPHVASLDAIATELARRSGQAAVVSGGADGVVASRRGEMIRMRPPMRISGNPTGAGDALNAGLVRGLANASDLTTMLRDAVALAAAAVASPVAGAIDAATYSALQHREVPQES